MTGLVFEGNVTPAGMTAPATATVAELLHDRLERVTHASARLGQDDDAEALHDFRVSIRRLRSLFRIYRPLTDEAIPRRLRRQLRRIGRATNLSRDLQVKLGWLAQQTDSLRPRERTGQRWLTARLGSEQQTSDTEAFALVESELPPLQKGLAQRLGELTTRSPDGGASFATVTAGLLLNLTEELEQHLGRVLGIEDQEEAHEARIAGKRIRYLLEPLAAAVPVAGELVQRLKSLQDLLGEMHDADVAAQLIASAVKDAATEGAQRVAARVRAAALDAGALRRERRRDPLPGLLALASRVQQRRQAAWDELARDWLPHTEPRLLEPLRMMTEALEQQAPPVEIERKFLLRGLPERVLEETPAEIEQGYLPGERIQERVRRVTSRGGTRCYRTIKVGSGLTRQEFEEPISDALFDALWPLTEGRRVRKRRYRIADGQLAWEIDEFTDRELVLAEIELPDAALQPPAPEWLAPYVAGEVTHDPSYFNISLAR